MPTKRGTRRTSARQPSSGTGRRSRSSRDGSVATSGAARSVRRNDGLAGVRTPLQGRRPVPPTRLGQPWEAQPPTLMPGLCSHTTHTQIKRENPLYLRRRLGTIGTLARRQTMSRHAITRWSAAPKPPRPKPRSVLILANSENLGSVEHLKIDKALPPDHLFCD